MNNESATVRLALWKIIQERGTGVLKKPNQLCSMLKDYAPGQTREIRLLSNALREGIGDMLLDAVHQDKSEQQRCIICGKKLLVDNLYLSEDAASLAVETIASALEIDIIQSGNSVNCSVNHTSAVRQPSVSGQCTDSDDNDDIHENIALPLAEWTKSVLEMIRKVTHTGSADGGNVDGEEDDDYEDDDEDDDDDDYEDDDYEDALESIKDLCNEFREAQTPDLFHVTPNLLSQLQVGNDEEVYLAHDDTLFQTGKNGFVITNAGIHCRSMFGKPVFTDFSELAYTSEIQYKNVCEPYADEALIAYLSNNNIVKNNLITLFWEICAILSDYY